MSDTPRTDAALDGLATWPQPEAIIYVARQLERELAAMRAERDALREDMDWLERAKCAYYYEGAGCWRVNEDCRTDALTLRESIALARKEAQP